MSATKNSLNKGKQSWFNFALVFLAINCIIVSALTFLLTIMAVLSNHYDKWFPVAIILSAVLFLGGRWILRVQRRKQKSSDV